MSGYKPPESNDSPDLTPMIDVVFLLIVFFMVVAQRMSEQYIELSALPVAGNSSVKEQPPPRTIISIDDTPVGQKFYWGEQEIDMEAIGTAVKRNPEWKVFLRVHPKVTHAVVQDVMKIIGNAGQADIIFGTWQVGT
ncbi:biopolymer transporter ExbD [Opitutales bacterium]|jgi:biopolymer transport protein ExbD|nr:biopolymer transporter ExbD [Opitutales bacterium]